MRASIRYTISAVVSGLLLTAAWPARGIPFLIFFAFVPLLYIEDGLSKSKWDGARFLGYSYIGFFIWNLLTTYWIYFSSPEGAYVAIGLNSFIMAMVMWLFHRVKQRMGSWPGYISLLVFWIGYEYLHLDWDLSWPWLLLGNVFANYVQVVQWYEITGVMGGTLWIWLVNILIFSALKKNAEGSPVRRQVAVIAVLVIIPIVCSWIRYSTYREKADPINVVLVQPNIDPWHDKFGRLSSQDQMNRMIQLAAPLTDSTTDYVILPETAIPTSVWNDRILENPQIQQIRAFVQPYPKLEFITGLAHLQMYRPGENIPETAEPYGREGLFFDDHNAAIQIDQSGSFPLYFKSKLVPGPEMFPFAEVLKPLQNKLFGQLGGMIGDMGTQKERTVFYNSTRRIYAAPVICYESIYGEFVGDYMLKGGNFISVSTNDAWWGNTPGYKQLLAYTRLRAIETRRSVARSANTGISCFINQRGDILQPTGFQEATAISGTINVNDSLSFYTRNGDYLGRSSVIFSILILLYAIFLKFTHRRRA